MNNKKTLEKIEDILINVDNGKISNSKAIIEIMNIMNGWRNNVIESHIISSEDLKELKKIKKKRKEKNKKNSKNLKSKKGWGRGYGY